MEIDTSDLEILQQAFARTGWDTLAASAGASRVMLARSAVDLQTSHVTAEPRECSVHGALNEGLRLVMAEALGTVSFRVAAGDTVREGDILFTLHVLDRIETIAADQCGIVDRVLVPSGSLVEYGQPVLMLRPRETP